MPVLSPVTNATTSAGESPVQDTQARKRKYMQLFDQLRPEQKHKQIEIAVEALARLLRCTRSQAVRRTRQRRL